MTDQALRSYELSKVNPPNQYVAGSEQCDGGAHDLYEPVTRFTQGYVAGGREHEQQRCYWCPDCRYKFAAHPDDHVLSVGRLYWEIETIERCDCGNFKHCACPS